MHEVGITASLKLLLPAVALAKVFVNAPLNERTAAKADA